MAHNGQSIGLSAAPRGGDLTLGGGVEEGKGALSITPPRVLEGRDRGVNTGEREDEHYLMGKKNVLKVSYYAKLIHSGKKQNSYI